MLLVVAAVATVATPVRADEERTARHENATTAIANVREMAGPVSAPRHDAEHVSTASRIENHVEYFDNPGDAYWGQGDITRYDASYQNGLIQFSIAVGVYQSPFSSSWRYGETGIVWDLDVTGDGTFDFYVGYVNVDGVVYAILFNSAEAFVCESAPSWNAAAKTYTVSFHRTCIGNPARFQFGVAMLFHEIASGVQSYDSAPDTGWVGPVLDGDAPLPPPPCVPSSAGPAPVLAGGYASLVPARLLDTRPDGLTVDCVSARLGQSPAGSVTILPVTARAGVPLDAVAVVLNVTVTEAQAAGFVTVYPCDEARPTASNLNFSAGATIPNLVIAKVGTGGRVCLFTQSATQLIADVSGFFPAGSPFVAQTPARLLDTRPGSPTLDGVHAGTGLIGGGGLVELQITGRAGVPTDAVAAVLNVTVTETTLPGFVTVYPCGEARPTASSLNHGAAATIPNAVVAKIGVDGRVCLFVQNATHLIVDVNGYFPAGAKYTPLLPARLLETRTAMPTIDAMFQGLGIREAGTTTELQVTGRGGIPVDATAVVLNVTVTDPQASGFVTVFPCGETRPNASNLNFLAGVNIPNAVIAKVGAGGRVCIFTLSATHIVVDTNGYFPNS